MKPADALARHRLARARTALQEADALIERQLFNGAMNRIYYAAFHAARAVLATQRLDSSRHTGVIALFQEHFVRTRLVPVDVARYLPRSFEKRQSSDYADFNEPSRDEVVSLRQQVDLLVEACERVVRAAE